MKNVKANFFHGKEEKKQKIYRDFDRWVTTQIDYPELESVLGKRMVVREGLLLILE